MIYKGKLESYMDLSGHASAGSGTEDDRVLFALDRIGEAAEMLGDMEIFTSRYQRATTP
jgi:hypothetical protein